MIELIHRPIEVDKVLQSVATERAGASVHFIGTVRAEAGIQGLDYECYEPMAASLLEEIVTEAKRQWCVETMAIVHRIGWVLVGAPSVVIAVSAAHRREAFAACEFAIERIKRIVPIWKHPQNIC